MAADKTVAVIGAGLGGLSASIYLAKKGFKVHVYEKNHTSGGKAGNLNTGKFRFDTGPTLLTMPFVLEDIFHEAGENISSYLKFEPLKILCKYFFSDGTMLNAFADTEKLAEEISLKTSDTKESVYKYFSYCKKIYELTADLFLFTPFHELTSLMNKTGLKTLVNITKIDPFRTVHQANETFFKDQKTIQLFDRYATYNGSSPFLAPATLNIIPYVENRLGAYLVTGGIYSIPSSLEKLARKSGVHFYFNSSVEKIILKGSKVNGVRIDGCDHKYDVVISNCDAAYTYKNLLSGGSSESPEIYRNSEPSSSAIVFYWGIKGIHNFLEIHNIIFSGNYRDEFDEIFNKKICPDDPTIYIYISSKFNSSDAPEGCENWFLMINAPYDSGQDWESMVSKVRSEIISKLNKMLGLDMQSLILTEKVLTPKDIESSTNSWKGSIYGASSNSRFSAFKRQQNRSLKYKGLYFSGGSAHPGGGIPLVLLSGKITSKLISKYHN